MTHQIDGRQWPPRVTLAAGDWRPADGNAEPGPLTLELVDLAPSPVAGWLWGITLQFTAKQPETPVRVRHLVRRTALPAQVLRRLGIPPRDGCHVEP